MEGLSFSNFPDSSLKNSSQNWGNLLPFEPMSLSAQQTGTRERDFLVLKSLWKYRPDKPLTYFQPRTQILVKWQVVLGARLPKSILGLLVYGNAPQNRPAVLFCFHSSAIFIYKKTVLIQCEAKSTSNAAFLQYEVY